MSIKSLSLTCYGVVVQLRFCCWQIMEKTKVGNYNGVSFSRERDAVATIH